MSQMEKSQLNMISHQVCAFIRESLILIFKLMLIVSGGEYWRLLTPGVYDIVAIKEGYEPTSKRVVVKTNSHEEAQRIDFPLKPIEESQMESDYYYGPNKQQPDNVALSNPEVLRLIQYLQRTPNNENPAVVA